MKVAPERLNSHFKKDSVSYCEDIRSQKGNLTCCGAIIVVKVLLFILSTSYRVQKMTKPTNQNNILRLTFNIEGIKGRLVSMKWI